MKTIKNRRSGDINFYPVFSLPKGEEVTHKGSFVVAEGETTGHKHVITVERPTDMVIIQTPSGRYFEIKAPARITHEEHGTITLDPGIYTETREREKDWFSGAARKV